MIPPDSEPARISTFSRVLAWILVVCSVLAVASAVFFLVTGSDSSDITGAVVSLSLILLMLPLFWYAAHKGRSPQWLTSIETMYDREAQRRGISTELHRRGRWVTYGTALLVFGGMLIAFGRKLRLFEGETGWFAAAVFFAAWLIVVLVFWRSYRRQA